MIKSFADGETEKIWRQQVSRRLPCDIQKVALRKLFMLARAKKPEDLAVPPQNRLKKLHESGGSYSIRINDQWRICFRFKGGDAYEVGIVDYH